MVFLYGSLSNASAADSGPLALAGLGGLALALLTFYVLQLGGRVLSWRLFFRVTEILLLLLGASLFLSGVEKLISMDYLPALLDPVWDSSALIDDMSPAGGVLAALVGYRAQPALTSVLAYAGFWLAMAALMARGKRQAAAR